MGLISRELKFDNPTNAGLLFCCCCCFVGGGGGGGGGGTLKIVQRLPG